MVNARINSLPRPIKWFSVPRLFRAENPQRGRLREFFQWNVDVIGSDDVLADAECIFAAADLLAEVGLTPDDAVIRVGSRPLTMAALRTAGVDDADMDAALTALDRRPKVSEQAFAELAMAAGIPAEKLADLSEFQDAPDLAAVVATAGASDETGKLQELFDHLAAMGAGDYCRLDMRIVRGLAYYTGIVYEVWDAAGRLRAVAGGGRYDNLLEVLGGPKVGATGFGMGDAVLAILLGEAGKLPDLSAKLDCFVVGAGDVGAVLRAVGALRRGGVSADYSMRQPGTGKQLKEANRRNARYAAILLDGGKVGVKDLGSGEQTDVAVEEFLAEPRRLIS